MKICSQCKSSKELNAFYDGKATCKNCMSENNKAYRQKHRDKILAYKKKYYLDNIDDLLNVQKEYGLINKEAIADRNHRYYTKNKEKLLEYAKIRSRQNRAAIVERRNVYEKKRRKNDPVFSLRKDVSRQVCRALRNNSSSKRGESTLSNLSYSIKELKEHLEKQFEPWMTWDNRGKYDPQKWDDSDPSTWTWQIDHIIPRSSLQYSSMSDVNFKSCWALNNLRPLSSKQNIIDGITRARHI